MRFVSTATPDHDERRAELDAASACEALRLAEQPDTDASVAAYLLGGLAAEDAARRARAVEAIPAGRKLADDLARFTPSPRPAITRLPRSLQPARPAGRRFAGRRSGSRV